MLIVAILISYITLIYSYKKHLSFSTGMLMYEIHMPLILLAKMKMENGEISKEEAKKEFHRAILNLKMSLDILKYEPDGSFEKNIYDGAKGSVEPLEAFVSSL